MNPTSTILVVDDDSSHRTMLRTLIGGWGYRIKEADDGSAAIAAVEEHPFDLVLMDIRMLKISGIEALETIKSINPAIPVVIMTAYSSVETAVDAQLRRVFAEYPLGPTRVLDRKGELQRGHAPRFGLGLLTLDRLVVPPLEEADALPAL